MKFPSIGIWENLFSNWAWKWAFEKKKKTEEFLSQFKLENSKNWLSLWEEVLELSKEATPVLKEMQEKTNKLLKL